MLVVGNANRKRGALGGTGGYIGGDINGGGYSEAPYRVHNMKEIEKKREKSGAFFG